MEAEGRENHSGYMIRKEKETGSVLKAGKKIIFLDIDGTLVSAMAPPSALAASAVRAARANGHKVFLCTGRNMPIIGDDI